MNAGEMSDIQRKAEVDFMKRGEKLVVISRYKNEEGDEYTFFYSLKTKEGYFLGNKTDYNAYKLLKLEIPFVGELMEGEGDGDGEEYFVSFNKDEEEIVKESIDNITLLKNER